MISGNAVGKLHIGMPATAAAKIGNVTSDRLEPDSEGGQARVIRVLVAGKEVAAEVHEGRVWRIQVAQPGLRTSSGLGVGTTLAKLLELKHVEVHVAGSSLYLVSAHICGVSFRLSHELQTDKDFMTKWSSSALAKLPATVTVESILITGCTK